MPEPELPQTRGPRVKLQPLGDKAILVVFDRELNLKANRQAIQFSQQVQDKLAPHIEGVSSNLLSCLVRYNPKTISFTRLRQELQLMLSRFDLVGERPPMETSPVTINVHYGGEQGPDFESVCAQLETSPNDFVATHTASVLDVLALGFSPGFIYLGLHECWREFPRRTALKENIPAGSVLFAAGQTAITAVPIRTGWSVIGHCDLLNFDVSRDPPVKLRPGHNVKLNAVEVTHG
ncbi:5-oxoprolinase subunit B family protein [Maritalea mediterranea]|uniref:Allophanate hydrolase subunit 1 n=1 Tax=Maritalea mediterranea TaxID=2909667 RepID=A0ABS9E640_9HYPH|nr:carboxyltransferase domain-containing protein [Maritalea mediterranea]MCF4098336.1 allophanate hydrolase subunit 1 [Maritalea mediterranea]